MAKKATTKTPAKAKTTKAVKKPLNKSQLLEHLATETELTKADITRVFDALEKLLEKELSKKGTGAVTLPNLLKIERKERPATKARKGRNPATGEEITIPAKPKTTVVKARVLKHLSSFAAK